MFNSEGTIQQLEYIEKGAKVNGGGRFLPYLSESSKKFQLNGFNVLLHEVVARLGWRSCCWFIQYKFVLLGNMLGSGCRLLVGNAGIATKGGTMVLSSVGIEGKGSNVGLGKERMLGAFFCKKDGQLLG
ncbi:hypothetical protein DEO72_LG6g365 [Vigna unguiculata]|uniref:Uncharacterized protein n=1 Tax=Vigna unguiculata TaxID=3917 RepID=A0A4D6M4J2_VIGUN|nr:hypothetical protein DEO72_LG6g365 [Vigna unguiculata]